MPAVGHQTAANECAVCQRVQKQQLAHGVAQQHLRLRANRVGRRTSHRVETFALAKLKNAVETLGVTRDQNQQRIGVMPKQLPMGREDNFVFPFMGAGGDPNRTFHGVPLRTQLTCPDQQLRVDGQVELD